MNKYIISFVSAILFVLMITSYKEKQYTNDFAGSLEESTDYWLDVIGKEPTTPIRDIGNRWKTDYSLRNVLAYCMLRPQDKYITFNHDLINQMVNETGNADLVFQVIMHEYTHCEAQIGHLQMYGHFMNDGGAPWLDKNEVKDQFKDYVDYYRNFYSKHFREEQDLNTLYALTIEKDAEGNVVIKCPCSECTGLR